MGVPWANAFASGVFVDGAFPLGDVESPPDRGKGLLEKKRVRAPPKRRSPKKLASHFVRVIKRNVHEIGQLLARERRNRLTRFGIHHLPTGSEFHENRAVIRVG